MSPDYVRPCTLRRDHLVHYWWSRKEQRYFKCRGLKHSTVLPFRSRSS